ncbi:acyloxyacyl hydrolase [Nitratifractor sp.]
MTGTFAMAGGDLAPAPAPTMENSWFDAITVNYGQSKDHIDIYRIGLRRDFRSRWFESSVGYLSGYWEGSLNYWNGRGDENFGIALSPVFAYYFHLSETAKPYLEGGIGASLWSRTAMGPRDLSTHFLFEDRIGAGVRFEHWDLAIRYMHYSNAGIKKPNDGIDIFLASVSYRF